MAPKSDRQPWDKDLDDIEERIDETERVSDNLKTDLETITNELDDLKEEVAAIGGRLDDVIRNLKQALGEFEVD